MYNICVSYSVPFCHPELDDRSPFGLWHGRRARLNTGKGILEPASTMKGFAKVEHSEGQSRLPSSFLFILYQGPLATRRCKQMAYNKVPGMQGYKGNLNKFKFMQARRKIWLRQHKGRKTAWIPRRGRAESLLQLTGSKRSLPFHLQLLATFQSPRDREGTNAVREDFGSDITGYWVGNSATSDSS